MSDTTADLQRTIASAKDLQSVVRTMKALAASSIGQYEASVRALADYGRTVELGLSACFRHSTPSAPAPVGDPRSVAGSVGAVVFGSDQGLVGQFNDVVADFAVRSLAALPRTAHIWAVGERVEARLADAGITVAGRFDVPASVQGIAPLIGQILVDCDVGTTLHLFYNRPTSGEAYQPTRHQLLPLDDGWLRALAARPWPTRTPPQIVGERMATVGALIREYLFVSLFRACAESLASENASRLAAMQRADKNIDELLGQLTATFHRVRQSGIDEELFDVVAGFDAMTQRKQGQS
jgi:F-type H+-transporting ATPase subunit gamma